MVLASLQSFYDQFTTEVVNQSWFYPLLIAVGILLAVFFIARLRKPKSLRVYRDESGNASVTRKALNDLVHLACAKIDTASKPKIEIKPNRGRLDMTIKIKLYEGQRLNELRDKLRRSVIKTFEENHGIRLGDINVMVIGFKKGGSDNEPVEDSKPIFKDAEEDEPKPDRESDKPDITTVAALGGGIGTDNLSPTNAPAVAPVEEDELAPAPEEEPTKKSFFSWGKKKNEPGEPPDDEFLEEEDDEGKPGEEGFFDSDKK